ncbi:MAG: prepilin-type N-terminal cleavage/methylation domain-containing protein [Magnetococcales bacterium]|nr:prepilin-type N-terminal cleavage/methylation domain-containing protein [Magnetococcales bacterium]
MTRREAGFTLIEIAIVVVIIGLLLGGILTAREMIRGARVHSLANRGSAVKAAILGFGDRFSALPGDYAGAASNLPGMANLSDHCAGAAGKRGPGNGDGNNRIGGLPEREEDLHSGCKRADELAFAWRHLVAAGFLAGSFDGKGEGVDEAEFNCRASTCPANPYNGGMLLFFNHQQYTNDFEDPRADGTTNQLSSGRNIPVEVIAELDRKIDDGDPATGSFRIADFFVGGRGGAGKTRIDACANDVNTTSNIVTWNIGGLNPDCGGIFLF